MPRCVLHGCTSGWMNSMHFMPENKIGQLNRKNTYDKMKNYNSHGWRSPINTHHVEVEWYLFQLVYEDINVVVWGKP